MIGRLPAHCLTIGRIAEIPTSDAKQTSGESTKSSAYLLGRCFYVILVIVIGRAPSLVE